MLIWMLVFVPPLVGQIFPQLPLGRWCHDTTTERIIALIEQIERRHVLAMVVALVALQAFAAVMPLDTAFFALLDVATYLDVAIAVTMVAAWQRWTIARASLQARFRFILIPRRTGGQARRSARAHRRMSCAVPANDDDHCVRRAA